MAFCFLCDRLCRWPPEGDSKAADEYSLLKVTSLYPCPLGALVLRPPGLVLRFSPLMEPPLAISRSNWLDSLAAMPDFLPMVPLGGRPVGPPGGISTPPFCKEKSQVKSRLGKKNS